MTAFIYPGNRIPGLVTPSGPILVQTDFCPQQVSVIYSSPSGYNTEKYNQPHAAFIKHCLETCLGSPDKTYVCYNISVCVFAYICIIFMFSGLQNCITGSEITVQIPMEYD